MSRGIDYGFGKTNIDHKTGIRYGVISQNSVGPDAIGDLEPDDGDPTCPECGGDVIESSDPGVARRPWNKGKDYACPECKKVFWSDSVFGDQPIGFGLDDGQYKLTSCLDSDLMVLDSPYYTFAAFCSPCVPGACSLDSPCVDGDRCYALGHDWFEGGVAPYPLYRVSDGTLVAGA